MKTRTIRQSLGWAFEGVVHVFRHEPNMRIHWFCMMLALLSAYGLGLPESEVALIILTSAGVLGAECANTAVEAAVDLLSPEHHPRAKVAKDVAAAGVLIAAVAAVIVGVLLFGPPLWELLAHNGSP